MADAPEGLAVVVRRGVRLFNRGRYLSAQQIWEAAWVEAAGDDRPFLESLVQLAGGLHLRTRRGGEKGAEHLLQRALATLEDFRPSRAGVDVDALLTEFGAYLDWIKEIRRPHRIIDALRIPRLR